MSGKKQPRAGKPARDPAGKRAPDDRAPDIHPIQAFLDAAADPEKRARRDLRTVVLAIHKNRRHRRTFARWHIEELGWCARRIRAAIRRHDWADARAAWHEANAAYLSMGSAYLLSRRPKRNLSAVERTLLALLEQHPDADTTAAIHYLRRVMPRHKLKRRSITVALSNARASKS